MSALPSLAEREAHRARREANPVLLRELRTRFRGPRAFKVLTTFLVFTSILAWAVYLGLPAGGNASAGTDLPRLAGSSLFGALLAAELLTVVLVAPSLTMAAISGEVERRTYELLLATPLSAGQILGGKLAAAMAYVLLLVVSALPVTSLALVLGGVSVGELLRGHVAVLVAGLLLASLGLAASALLKRTERAAILAYLGAAALCLGPPVLIWLLGALGLPGGALRRMLTGLLLAATPLASTAAASRNSILDFWFGGTAPSASSDDGGFLLQALSFQLWLSAALTILASRRIRTGRPSRRAALVLAALLLVWLIWVFLQPADWQTVFGAGGAP